MSLLHKREALFAPPPCNGCCPTRANDNTKDIYLHKQVTQLNNCNGVDCGVNHIEMTTFGYEIVGGLNSPYNSVGFGVSQEWTSGNEYNCGTTGFKEVCVWASVKYLEYQVREIGPACETGGDTNKVTMRAPSTDTSQNHYYCMTGPNCKGLGEQFYDGQTRNFQEYIPQMVNGIVQKAKQQKKKEKEEGDN